LNILDGVTADTSELNILDGVTADTSELNILDGVTADTSELNILDGVTADTAELNILDGVTATTGELNYLVGVTDPIQTQIDRSGIKYTRYTSNITVEPYKGVIADTSGGTFTVTLPATPTTGDTVVIVDGADWSATNLIVGRNGSTIEGDAADMTMDIGGVAVQFTYDGTTWQIYAQVGINSGAVLVSGDNVSELTNDAGYLTPTTAPDLTQAQVEDDTSTVFGQVSGQRLSQAVAANGLGGSEQTAQDLSGSRARFTVYQNTTGRPIWVCAQYQVGTGSIAAELFISADNVTFFVTGKSSPSGSNNKTGVSSIVPVNFYYKVETNVDPDISELRWIEIR
ncbi:hypothetical protein N8222_09400, partial [Oceanospirillaceae bacterium]|nr:hypothetical protein [Oceanospirillaceae bacterium]